MKEKLIFLENNFILFAEKSLLSNLNSVEEIDFPNLTPGDVLKSEILDSIEFEYYSNNNSDKFIATITFSHEELKLGSTRKVRFYLHLSTNQDGDYVFENILMMEA